MNESAVLCFSGQTLKLILIRKNPRPVTYQHFWKSKYAVLTKTFLVTCSLVAPNNSYNCVRIPPPHPVYIVIILILSLNFITFFHVFTNIIAFYYSMNQFAHNWRLIYRSISSTLTLLERQCIQVYYSYYERLDEYRIEMILLIILVVTIWCLPIFLLLCFILLFWFKAPLLYTSAGDIPSCLSPLFFLFFIYIPVWDNFFCVLSLHFSHMP